MPVKVRHPLLSLIQFAGLRRPSHPCAGRLSLFRVAMSIESEIVWMRVLVQFAREQLIWMGAL